MVGSHVPDWFVICVLHPMESKVPLRCSSKNNDSGAPYFRVRESCMLRHKSLQGCTIKSLPQLPVMLRFAFGFALLEQKSDVCSAANIGLWVYNPVVSDE